MKQTAWCSLKNGIYVSKCGRYVCWFRANRYGLSISYDEKLRSNKMTIDRLKQHYNFVCYWEE